MKKIAFIILLLLLTLTPEGCSPKRSHFLNTTQTDSTRVDVRKETVFVTDTVFVEIPPQVAERTTRDSTSHLENDYATTDARINTDGTLYHDLKTKPQKKAVEFQKPVERRDSIVYRYVDRVVTEYIEKEVQVKKPLAWWVKLHIYGFWIAVVVILIISKTTVFSFIKKLFGI